MQSKAMWAVVVWLCMMILAMLACQANAVNMKIGGIPMYICPSATPKPTDVPPPPDPPTYPATFQANLNYSFVDPTRSVVSMQYLAQSVGWVQVDYRGTDQGGMTWGGSNGLQNVVFTGVSAPGVSSFYSIFIPTNVVTVQIAVSSSAGSYSFSVTRSFSTVSGNPAPPPCCLPGAIFPTPRPTYTPYPTPTAFSMTSDFFLDDPVYNNQPPIQLRLRLKSPIQSGSLILPFFGLGWTAASWTLEITNVGTKEYDFLGAGYMYISEVNIPGTGLKTGVWSPAHDAAQFLGIVEQAYGPKAVQPGETIVVTVAAWIPVKATVSKVSLVLDPYKDGDPGWATFTPGQERIATWMNRTNTICKGEIKYP